MKAMFRVRAASFPLVVLGALAISGCGGAKGPEAGKQAMPAADSSSTVAVNWCVEHGVPEDICGQCNAKVAADCQQKGDWCKEHNRPESQCFLCNPKLADRFAAEYEAKYGKKPPKPDGK
jgi:cobalt-zinc-cadmium efflux system membrane fusion protein